MIGIVGGLGPLAGADLYRKIFDNTLAATDQDHLPVLMASLPGEVPDRTAFLTGKSDVNPAYGLVKVIGMLEKAGASLIGIACNTVHVPLIFNLALELLNAGGSKAEILNLIEVTVDALKMHPEKLRKIGLMYVSGTYNMGLYQPELRAAGYEPLTLTFEQNHTWVHEPIYDIKKYGENVPQHAIDQLNLAFATLKENGADGLILACTEIGMIEHLLDFQGLAVFNPNTILARALIGRFRPERLKGGKK